MKFIGHFWSRNCSLDKIFVLNESTIITTNARLCSNLSIASNHSTNKQNYCYKKQPLTSIRISQTEWIIWNEKSVSIAKVCVYDSENVIPVGTIELRQNCWHKRTQKKIWIWCIDLNLELENVYFYSKSNWLFCFAIDIIGMHWNRYICSFIQFVQNCVCVDYRVVAVTYVC